jgi:hypothetical protein
MWETWMVQLRLNFVPADRPAPGDQELEPMVELMERTQGVCSAAVVPREGGLAVAIGLSAPDAGTAEARAAALAVSCARYAHLGQVELGPVRSALQPNAGVA